MKTMIRKLTALSLALLLCLPPMMVQAESLLGERLAKAFDAGRTIEVTIGLEADDNLAALGLMPQESFAAVQEVLIATTLRISVTQGSAGLPEIGLELRMGETPIADGRAWLEDDQLAMITSLLPGKTFLIDAGELFKGFQMAGTRLTALEADLQVLASSLGSYVIIIGDWVNSAEGMITISQEATAGTEWQDASVQSYTLRVTPEQLKELFIKLREEFMRADGKTQIITVNATSLEEIQAIVPTDNVMEWVLRMDQQGGIAAIEGVVPPLFEGNASEGVFSYQHFTANSAEFPHADSSLEKHHFMAQMTEEGGGSSFSLALASDPKEPRGSVNVLMHQADQGASTIIALDHHYTGTKAAERETLESKTSLNVQQLPESISQPGDAAAALPGLEETTGFSAAADFTGETRTQGQDDFLSKSALGVSIMGMPLGRVHVALTSFAYAPADTTSNTPIDLASLDEAGAAALNQELNAGLEQAMSLAMAQSPELLQLIMMMQQ